jgi:O-antigen/teichoic acid export membrane protein
MTRHLGEVDYGYYATVSSLLFILVGLTEAGLTNLGMREYAVLSGAERENFLRDLVGLRLILSLAGVVVAVLFAWATGRPASVVEGTAIMGVGMLLTLTQQTYSVPLSAELRLGWVAALEFLKQLVLSGTILLLVIVGASLVPFFWASVASGATMLVVTLVALRSEAGLLPAFHADTWGRILRQTLPYALAAAVGLVYFRLAILLLGGVSTDREVGLYSAAFKAVETLGVVPWLLVSSAFPVLARAARDDADRLRYGTGRVLDVAVLTGTPMGLGLLIGAPFVIQVIAGADFKDAVPVLHIQALSLVTSFLVSGGVFSLLAMERFRDLVIANLAATLTSAVLTLSLGPSLGAKGAAIATLAAEAVLAVGYLIALGHQDRRLLPSPLMFLRILPGAAGMLLVAWALHVHPALEAIIAGVVYVPLAWVCGAIPPELIDALLRRDPASKEHTA